MPSRRIWWLAVGRVAVAAAGCSLAVRPAGQGPALIPDPARAPAMMPAIVAYLDSPAYRQAVMGDFTAADHQAGPVKWLCSAVLVEVRPDGGRWRAGIDVACGDYDRRGSWMYQEDGGDMGDAVMVLSGGSPDQVVSVAVEPGISIDPAWVSGHFSARAAAEINSATPPEASTPDDSALRAFGCFDQREGLIRPRSGRGMALSASLTGTPSGTAPVRAGPSSLPVGLRRGMSSPRYRRERGRQAGRG